MHSIADARGVYNLTVASHYSREIIAREHHILQSLLGSPSTGFFLILTQDWVYIVDYYLKERWLNVRKWATDHTRGKTGGEGEQWTSSAITNSQTSISYRPSLSNGYDVRLLIWRLRVRVSPGAIYVFFLISYPSIPSGKLIFHNFSCFLHINPMHFIHVPLNPLTANNGW